MSVDGRSDVSADSEEMSTYHRTRRSSTPNIAFHLRPSNTNKEKQQIKELQAQLEESLTELGRQQLLNDKLTKDIEDLQEDNRNIEDELEKTKEEVDETQNELSHTNVQLEKQKLTNKQLADRCRLMEHRTLELERLQIELQNTKSNLEGTQIDLRRSENEVATLQDKLADEEKLLRLSHEENAQLLRRIESLNWQAQSEALRHHSIEKRLEGIPLFELKISELEKKVESLEKELTEKDAQLHYSKKSSQQHRDKSKLLEKKLDEMEAVRQAFELSKAETSTLRKLVLGKNALVIEKTHELEATHSAIEKLEKTDVTLAKQIKKLINSTTEPMYRSQKGLEPLNGKRRGKEMNGSVTTTATASSYTPSEASTEITLSNSSHRQSRSLHGVPLRHTLSLRSEGPDSRRLRPLTADLHRSGSARINRAMSAKSSASQGDLEADTPRSRVKIGSVTSTLHSDFSISSERSSVTGDLRSILGDLTVQEKLSLLHRCVEVGDKVQVRAQPLPGQAGPSKLQCATVKYIGRLDKKPSDTKIYFGLKLESPDGDTDGTYNNKRYFAVPYKFGRIISTRCIVSVYSHQTKGFRSLCDLLREKRDESF